jgi:hypothetical protein
MAFNDGRLVQARKLQPDDRLLLYASKRALGNLGRKSGLLVGEATVSAEVRQVRQPVTVGAVRYRHIVAFSLERLAPLGEGVALSAHLDDLELFPDPRNWTSQIRRTVVPLSERDASFLSARLAPIATDPARVLKQYQALAARSKARQAEPASSKQAPTVLVAEHSSFLLDLLA